VSDDEDREAIRAIYDASRARLLDRVGTVEAAVDALIAGDLESDAVAAGEGEAHKLAGSLGTFGVPGGSEVARELEHLLAAPPAPGDAQHAQALAAKLRAAVEGGPA
jgi:HPt (histidine-containing phosphotransfer) domain-containing protein